MSICAIKRLDYQVTEPYGRTKNERIGMCKKKKFFNRQSNEFASFPCVGDKSIKTESQLNLSAAAAVADPAWRR